MSFRPGLLPVLGLLLVCISACSSAPPPIVPPTSPAITSALPAASPEPTIPAPTALPDPTSTVVPYTLPLSDFGPNFIGKRFYGFEDDNRSGRAVNITVWYPAIKPEGFTGTSLDGADPDPAGAPYPVVLSSTKVAGTFAPHLVTHGFVVVSVNKLDTYYQWGNDSIDQPLDLLFALAQVGSTQLEGLEGVINGEQAGAMGYSFDGYNALAMSGARVDPEFFLSQCADSSTAATLWSYAEEAQCGLIHQWDAFAARAGSSMTARDDGLWEPMTDVRIRAVMPLAPDGWFLFGERGLAAVDRPVLIIVGTRDLSYPENLLIFEHLGTPEKTLISFIGRGHMMIYAPEEVAHMKHFAAAFFGYHLQGRQDYAAYFSYDFIAQYRDLAWGPEPGNQP